MLTTSEIIQMFLSMKAQNTQLSYRTAIKQLETRCGPLTEVTPSMAMQYFSELKASDVSAATLRQRFNVLTSLFNYLVDMQVIDRNPLRPVARAISWRQAAQVRPTALVDFALVHRILRAPPANTKLGIRDRAIMALFFGSGIRRTEALNLKIESIKAFKAKMYLDLEHTKAGKRQTRGIAKFAWKYLSIYISQRKSDGAQNEDPLFVFYYRDGSIRGAMSQKTIYRVFVKYCAKLGIKAAPHAARATFSTALHRKTRSELVVSKALGHAGTAQVGKYVKALEQTALQEIIDLDYK